MKSKIFSFISKSNQILFFLVAVGIIVTMLSSVIPHTYAPATVKIKKSTEKNNQKEDPAKMQYHKSFYKHIKDVYIIKVQADTIMRKEILYYASPRLASVSNYDQSEHALVNLIFSKEDKKSYKLLVQDAYIISFGIASDGSTASGKYGLNHFKLEKNIYEIVSNDTNGDELLSTKDKKDFYITNYDGKQMKSILKDISNYELIADNLVLITKKVDKQKQFYLFDVTQEKLKLLDTKI